MIPAIRLLIGLIGANLTVVVAQTTREFSQSNGHDAMAAAAHSPLDMFLVGLGVVVVLLTTFYSLRYLIRPGERGRDHVKRRILEDGHEGFR